MSYHAYIDESGVNHNETVMVVAMVVLHGSRSAEKLRKDVLAGLFDKSSQMAKTRQKRQLRDQELHFVDMKYSHKLITSKYLSKADITCYVSYYWHQATVTNYKIRFKVYTELVKNCLKLAFEKHQDILVNIAKQGGWQTYKRSFLKELKLIPEHYVKNGQFRKGKFELVSGAHPGVQIADFYAGAYRDWLRSKQHKVLAIVYESLKHQITQG